MPPATGAATPVIARELNVPKRAVRNYMDAQRGLEKRDVEGAGKHLEHAEAPDVNVLRQ
jgi:hypothetical protein